VKDTEWSLTITLAIGKGVIIDAYAKNLAGAKITKAVPGQELTIVCTVRNDGETDYIWWWIKDKDTGTIVFEPPVDSILPAGKTSINESVILKMPNRNWNLLCEAGHGSR